MHLIVDGDIYVYRAAVGCERSHDWGDDMYSLVADARQGWQQLESDLEELRDTFPGEATDMTLCLTGTRNWRKEENPNYKLNRKGKRKPLAMNALLERLRESYTCSLTEGLEADDLMGLMSNGRDTCIVSIDKDMRGVPGLLFNPDKMTEVQTVTVDDADHWHMLQTLMGDVTDGYPGCPGVGPVGAAKLLDPLKGDAGAMWAAAMGAFNKEYSKAKWKGDVDAEEQAILNARMARICRHGDWDWKKGEMVWSPPRLR